MAAELANDDNRDPGDPGLVIIPGTSSPPLCLCLIDALIDFDGEAVADRAGGAVGGLEVGRLLSSMNTADVLEPDARSSVCASRFNGGGALCDLDPRFFE